MTGRAVPVRPSYRRALLWIVENDDTEWLETPEGETVGLSVTASLVADMFGHSDEKLEKDLRRALMKSRRE
ncbi:MAG: hypothetical protein KGH75_01630 [Rhodospirillales bacterium]|nr:hypothetical protein [Rhodospirillales bacterium]